MYGVRGQPTIELHVVVAPFFGGLHTFGLRFDGGNGANDCKHWLQLCGRKTEGVYVCVRELICPLAPLPDAPLAIFFSICFVVSSSEIDIYFMLQLHFNFPEAWGWWGGWWWTRVRNTCKYWILIAFRFACQLVNVNIVAKRGIGGLGKRRGREMRDRSLNNGASGKAKNFYWNSLVEYWKSLHIYFRPVI